MITVSGIPALQEKLRQAARVVPGQTKQELARAGMLTEMDAKTTAPVDTGKLRQSIYFETLDGGFTVRVTANTSYAAYVEYGTSRQRAQPYLIPAYRRRGQELIERLRRILRGI